MKLPSLAMISIAMFGLAACEPTPEQNTANAEQAAKQSDPTAADAVGVEALGELIAANGWARETAEGAKAGGGFVTIVNGTHNGDALLGASANFADEVQVHRTTQDEGVARMERINENLPVPAGATLKLRPGGLHLMFFGLKEPLRAGDVKLVTLNFQQAGTKKVPFIVRSMAEGDMNSAPASDMPMEGHGDHGGS